MLLVIDIGNTDLKCAAWRDGEWLAIWRFPTRDISDGGELSTWLSANLEQATLAPEFEAIACASVVPRANAPIGWLAEHSFGLKPFFVSLDTAPLQVRYDPPESVGADRLANAVGGMQHSGQPFAVVDFGSATTLTVVSGNALVGGAILPGVRLQAEMLASRTAALPEVPLEMPSAAIGHSTQESIQSGVLFGHLGGIEGLLGRMQAETEGTLTVLATGGLSGHFIGATRSIHHFVPQLTLDGIVEVWKAQA